MREENVEWVLIFIVVFIIIILITFYLFIITIICDGAREQRYRGGDLYLTVGGGMMSDQPI